MGSTRRERRRDNDEMIDGQCHPDLRLFHTSNKGLIHSLRDSRSPMSETAVLRDPEIERAAAPDFLGHPPALPFLFATEMWERFSYYGMKALLVLYLVKYVLLPETAGTVIGLGSLKHGLEAVFGPLDIQPLASQVYGLYGGLVYLTPVLGGFLADRVLGQRRTVIIGALLMAIGHFMMAFEHLLLFALAFLILGNGAFKPNMSAQVGTLYAPGDPRRDRAYSIFYVGINLGAFLAPLVCGTLGERVGWHYGFAAAGVGMLIGLATYLYASPRLPPDQLFTAQSRKPLGPDDRRAIVALLISVRAGEPVLGDLRAAGQYHRAVGGREHRPYHRPPVLAGRDSNHLVPVRQSLDDLRLHALRGGVVGAPGVARHRAFHPHQDGAGLLRLRGGQRDHGRRRPLCRSGQGELALAVRLFRGPHHG